MSKACILSLVILSPGGARAKNLPQSQIQQILLSSSKIQDPFRVTNIKSTRLLFLLYLVLFFLGCYPSARLKLPPEEFTPERVLHRAVLNQGLINTSASLINFNFRSPQESFSGDLELFFKKPDTLAFNVKALLGPDLATGLIKKDSLLLYFPRIKQYYKGKSLNCAKKTVGQAEIDFFCLLRILAVENQIKEEMTFFAGADEENYIYVDTVEIWKRSLWVDKDKALLRKIFWERTNSSGLNEKEFKGFMIEYKDFENFKGIRLAQVIEIKSLDRKERLRLRVLERKINSPLSEKKFQIKIPEEAEPLEIDKSS